MSVLTEIRPELQGHASITGLLSSPDAIFCGFVPRQAAKVDLPYLIFDLLSDPGHYHLDGPAGVRSPAMQVGCWGRTPMEADQLADAVEAALNNRRGMVGATRVHGCFKRDRRGPTPYDPQTGDSAREWEVQIDFDVWHA